MKKYLGVTLALLASVAAFAADNVPIFNATLTMGNQNRFVLIGADGKASSWLQIGDTFDGYTLKNYDAKADALDLERESKVTRVILNADAAVVAGQLPSTPATLADAENVLNKMHFEQMMDRMMVQQKSMMGKMVDQMGAGKNVPPEFRAEFVAFQKKMMDEMVNAMGLDKMKDDVAKIYSEVFNKQELDALASFYATPAGEALNEKQPLIQQKMQEIMMPRMMAAMPKIQQMSREFGEQMKAKKKAAAEAKAAAEGATAPASEPAPNP